LTKEPDFLSLFFEGFAVARQSELVNTELATLYGKFRKALETGLQSAFDRHIILKLHGCFMKTSKHPAL
jgi:hypothetical protein